MEESEEYKIFKASQKFATQYLTGHPLLDEPEFVYLLKGLHEIQIIQRKLYSDDPPYNTLATIPYNAIVGIDAEDHSDIEKKFSLGKFMVIGAYSLAYPKKEQKEAAYLVIKWKVEYLEYTTIFKNEDKGSLESVNHARNAIQHWIKTAQS